MSDHSDYQGTAVAALEARQGDWPHTKSNTSSNEENKRNPASAPHSPSATLKPSTSQSNHSDYFSANEHTNRNNHPPMPGKPSNNTRLGDTGSHGSREHSPARLAHATSTQARADPPRSNPTVVGGTRHLSSKTGGMQVILDGSGSWTHVAHKSATLPSEGLTGPHVAKAQQGGSVDGNTQLKPHGHHQHNGVLGFLSRKKGREKSPKPQENGVLGKEGARVVINSGK